MVKGLGPGEWWRSSGDWHYDACGAGRARAASALDVPSLAAPRPLHHRARRRADRRRPLGEGDGYDDGQPPPAAPRGQATEETESARAPSLAVDPPRGATRASGRVKRPARAD